MLNAYGVSLLRALNKCDEIHAIRSFFSRQLRTMNSNPSLEHRKVRANSALFGPGSRRNSSKYGRCLIGARIRKRKRLILHSDFPANIYSLFSVHSSPHMQDSVVQQLPSPNIG